MRDEELQSSIRATVASRLDRLVEEIGRSEPAALATTAFLDRLDEAVVAIATASDPAALDGAAHQLAGSAETLGALQLGAVAREVMRLVRASPTAQLPDELRDRLREVAAATRDVMVDELVRIRG